MDVIGKSPAVSTTPLKGASSSSLPPRIRHDTDEHSKKETATSSQSEIRCLPKKFIECQREDLITLISRMLESLITINDNIRQQITSNQLTRFHSRAPPAISVHSYLTRLAQYSSLENAILLTSIYYIDLLSTSYPTFSLNSLTVHRFLLTATMVAAKGLCDSFCSNHHYAKVGGVHVSELNILEIEFLNKVNWRIVPRDANMNNGNTGVGSAADVLDMYYNRMVMLVGKGSKAGETTFQFDGERSVLKRPADQELEQRLGNNKEPRSPYITSKRNR